MPADTVAYVATEFDPGSDQYLQLSSLAARLVIPGAGDTISSIVETLTALLAKIPSELTTVLQGEVGIGIAGSGIQDDSVLGEPGRYHRITSPCVRCRAPSARSRKCTRVGG
jgi:hypothetical protein